MFVLASTVLRKSMQEINLKMLKIELIHYSLLIVSLNEPSETAFFTFIGFVVII